MRLRPPTLAEGAISIASRSLVTSYDKGMRAREQLLITVYGLPRLTEMKSMKSPKRGQSVMNLGRTAAAPCPRLHRKHSYDAAKNTLLYRCTVISKIITSVSLVLCIFRQTVILCYTRCPGEQ